MALFHQESPLVNLNVFLLFFGFFLSEALQQLNKGLEPRECEFYLEKPKVPVHYRIYTSGSVQLQVHQDIIIITGKHPL